MPPTQPRPGAESVSILVVKQLPDGALCQVNTTSPLASVAPLPEAARLLLLSSMITDTAETFTGQPLKSGPPGSPGNRIPSSTAPSVPSNAAYRPADEIPADELPDTDDAAKEATDSGSAAADEES